MPFKLSTRGHYAVLLMYELARSRQDFTSLSEVSKRQNISQGYLEQIIRPLREADLVTSRKGAGGGYALARSPKDITIGEVVRAVEGPIAPVECVEEHYPLHTCPSNCKARLVWQKVGQAIDEVLDSTTLESLVLENE